MNIGILDLQGSVLEFMGLIERYGDNPIPVKESRDLEGLDGLIIPGGESTTIGKLLKIKGLDLEIKERVKEGLPVWGTCAGVVLLNALGLIDLKVQRNAYGSQLNSFTKELVINEKTTSISFIRAPQIESVGESVTPLIIVDDQIVAAKDKSVFVTTFHSELTERSPIYEYFISNIGNNSVSALILSPV